MAVFLFAFLWICVVTSTPPTTPTIELRTHGHRLDAKYFVSPDGSPYPLTITLFWETYIYIYTIYPIKSTHVYVFNTTKKSQLISDKSQYLISFQYKAAQRINIDYIKIRFTSNNVYYKINAFCVPSAYDYLNFDITTKRLNDCNQPFKMSQYHDIGIGQQAGITKHSIEFIDDILNYPNQTKQGIVIPPQPILFGIRVADIDKKWNPQTKYPITLSLYWYTKFYQCIIHPTEINQTYLCDVSNANITSICDIDIVNNINEKYVLLIEKSTDNKDSLIIDKIIVYDETYSIYEIKDFCFDPQDIGKADYCMTRPKSGKEAINLFTAGTCDEFVGPIKSMNELIKCNIVCSDSNDCSGISKLHYYFPSNLYKLKNKTMQSAVSSAGSHDAGYCHNGRHIHDNNEINSRLILKQEDNTVIDILNDRSNKTNDSQINNITGNLNVEITDDLFTTSMNMITDGYMVNSNQYENRLFFMEIIVGILVILVSIILCILWSNSFESFHQNPLSKPIYDSNGSDTISDDRITTDTGDSIESINYFHDEFEHLEANQQSMDMIKMDNADEYEWDHCNEYDHVICDNQHNDAIKKWSKIDVKPI